MNPASFLASLLLAGPAHATTGAPPPAAVQQGGDLEPPPDPRGDWRLDVHVVSHLNIPVLGTTTLLSSTAYMVRIEGTAEAPVLAQKPCALRTSATRPIATTTIPQAFVDALPPKRYPLVLTPEGSGWRVRGDMRPQYIGWDPAKTRTIPSSPDDPAVFDFERDGNPGATVHLDAPVLGEIEIYIVQVAHTLLDGTWDGGDAMGGRTQVKAFQQRSIAASNRLFVQNPEVRLDNAQSKWRLVRVPAGTTCADIAGRNVGGGPALTAADFVR